MKPKKYHIGALTNKLVGGNPACVIPLKERLPDELLFSITKENNLDETAFFMEKRDGFMRQLAV
jgi:predicted PhzF superfamily epimerase YddE/YHI9